MRLRDFVRAHRAEIDTAIARIMHGAHDGNRKLPRINDSDREDFIRNDEGLYSWARSEGANP